MRIYTLVSPEDIAAFERYKDRMQEWLEQPCANSTITSSPWLSGPHIADRRPLVVAKLRAAHQTYVPWWSRLQGEKSNLDRRYASVQLSTRGPLHRTRPWLLESGSLHQ